MSSLIYNVLKAKVLDASLDLDNDTLKAVLVDTTTSAGADPDKATVSALTTLGEIAGTTRQTLTVTVTQDNTNDRGQAAAASVTFTAVASGSTARGVLIIKSTGADSVNLPLVFLQFSSDIPTNGGNIVVDLSGGFLRTS